jgi:hypothetical protein
VLQRDQDGKPIHVVWGVPKNAISPAVVVTSYMPELDRCTAGFFEHDQKLVADTP